VGEVAGPKGQLGLELDFQWLSQTASGDVPGTLDVLNQYSILFTAAYTPVERLNLVVTLPYLWKKLQNQAADGTRTLTSSLNGVGDLQFGVRWFVWDQIDFGNRTHQSLSVNAGTFAPTGANDATVNGVRVDEHRRAPLRRLLAGPPAALTAPSAWGATRRASAPRPPPPR